MKANEPIAVFDSGVGGLSVLRELLRLLPEEKYLYFGDSANAPYGTRSTEEIRRLTMENYAALRSRGIKAAVIACNTATSAAIDLLRQTYPDDILVGIEPALKLAAARYPGGRIGVMATQATLREEKFARLMGQCAASCRVVPLPCPLLVEYVEQGKTSDPALLQYLQKRLQPYRTQPLDAIVLGCTHFPFARAAIAQAAGGRTELYDGGEGTARELKRRLSEHALLAEPGGGSVTLENSLPTPQMLERMAQLLQLP